MGGVNTGSLPQGADGFSSSRAARAVSTQSLLDLRVSRTFRLGGRVRAELMLDILNALNDAAEEALANDDLYGDNFGKASILMDPRRVMLGVRLNFGR